MAHILIVDDEQRMIDLLTLYLTPYQHKITSTTSGEDAVDKIAEHDFDLVLLDIMMPDCDGWETCTDIRSISDVPIIMVSARDQKPDIVKGLKLGADDYVTKPFDENELTARIGALLRRFSQGDVVEIDGLTWNGITHELRYQNTPVALTPKEFAMLGYLMKHPNKVFSREQLIELIWGFDSDTEGRTVDSHVRNLREKIRKAGFPIDDYLHTVWGVGYKWI
ncbi:response regulator transcription factor [Salisediminibacterium halotolerans]|uniref:response regulator transcription factor n=1 Tax=Salisediminibacterium halotolerans TaxID=517425 RepID=UPI000EB1201A|nr:response regulator transcription factor [Salisediminibacterium halotolerans]RLJ73143.1 DNA-binding response OmpR family regulator [Actinophytocola xinjiangensis]RPE86565.1 DNA-binding response OmpR family regulator [Salisediminibacterium halotolerans]TWG33940.1 DNA-binding response OmpR family regulator [Salisediminibacterium halotolerans]GEL08844.1 DNA-binding response regulator [Salisediminibacterium halotolerans]